MHKLEKCVQFCAKTWKHNSYGMIRAKVMAILHKLKWLDLETVSCCILLCLVKLTEIEDPSGNLCYRKGSDTTKHGFLWTFTVDCYKIYHHLLLVYEFKKTPHHETNWRKVLTSSGIVFLFFILPLDYSHKLWTFWFLRMFCNINNSNIFCSKVFHQSRTEETFLFLISFVQNQLLSIKVK